MLIFFLISIAKAMWQKIYICDKNIILLNITIIIF